jgi:hypothetical protein
MQPPAADAPKEALINAWGVAFADAWDANYPHEVYPAFEPEDRVCECMHVLYVHVANLRLGTLTCDERNGIGKKVCKCRDFVCYEHSDNRCSEYDLEEARHD